MENERRCQECEYDLRGLIENRCPECGLQFDPHSSSTMTRPTRRVHVVAAYLVPWALSSLLWIYYAYKRNGVGWHTLDLKYIADIITSNGCGPFATYLHPNKLAVWCIGCVSIYAIWFAIILRKRFRRIPIWCHFILALIWNFCGCCIIGIGV